MRSRRCSVYSPISIYLLVLEPDPSNRTMRVTDTPIANSGWDWRMEDGWIDVAGYRRIGGRQNRRAGSENGRAKSRADQSKVRRWNKVRQECCSVVGETSGTPGFHSSPPATMALHRAKNLMFTVVYPGQQSLTIPLRQRKLSPLPEPHPNHFPGYVRSIA